MEKQRIVLSGLVLLILIVVLLGNPSTTGFVPTKIYTQGLNIEVVQSQRFLLSSENNLKFSSLLISGEVVGKGLVNIYLVDKDHRKLVFSNKHKQGMEATQITGFATSELSIEPKEMLDVVETAPEGYAMSSGKFSNACEETCTFDDGKEKERWLDVVVENGTTVKISDIVFTVPLEE